MALSLLLAGTLMAQAAGAAVTVNADPAQSRDRVEVGFRELSEGRPHDAIARIRANPVGDASDPAALINLGAAYARLGQTDEAQASYRAAIASDNRYDLELADGSWVDSRRAARLALRRLNSGQVLALR